MMKNDFSVPATLVQKYNQPVPRYTSYPTVPSWKEGLNIADWKEVIQKGFEETNGQGLSLYIHLPFCESLCTYCGCNKKITTNHSVEERYIAALETEWKLYKDLMQQTPVIRELHIGGGTPTFFSAANLEKIMQLILTDCIVHPLREFSIEGHPNNTTREQLETLYKFGFRRISYGVQDNDATVQKI